MVERAGPVRVPLAGLRELAELTQAEMGRRMVTTQSAVARFEAQDDVRLSTLNRFVRAAGAHLRLVADFPDRTVELVMPVLEPRPARTFKVVWQAPVARRFVEVARLTDTGTLFEFAYIREATDHPEFEPFPEFPRLDETYRSEQLFDFFADRTARAAGSTRDLAEALGLTRQDATPVELMARSWATSPHDASVQVVPEPVQHGDVESMRFLASGVRHVVARDPERAEHALAKARTGDEIALVPEPDNEVNPKAVLLRLAGVDVGYIPDYLTTYLEEARTDGRPAMAFAEHVNGPETASHLRLLCRLEVGIAGSV